MVIECVAANVFNNNGGREMSKESTFTANELKGTCIEMGLREEWDGHFKGVLAAILEGRKQRAKDRGVEQREKIKRALAFYNETVNKK